MMANIPDDIIFYNILTRVPAIPLLRFKSVSKQWYNLISSTTFTSLQHDYAIASHNSTDSDLLIVFQDCNIDWSCSYTYLDAPCFTRAKEVVIETPHSNYRCIIGCCNGLVCIKLMREGRCGKGFVLCNPVTRESSRLIDDSPCNLPTDVYNYYESHGFGYDSISHDYKIVKITSLGDFSPHVAHIEIYSTGNDIWKQGGEVPYYMHLDGGYGVSLNNKLHWVIIDGYDGNSNLFSILTIDLHSGGVGKMPVPDKLLHLLEDGSRGFLDLMVSNGCLYSIMKRQIGTSKSNIISIWLMKEYGVSESWAKLCNLGDEVSSWIITYRSNKEREELLLLEFGDGQPDKLMWYNLKDKSIRKVDSTKAKRPIGKDWVCIGSLASIPAMIKGNVP